MSLEWVERIPKPPVQDIIKSSLGIETEGYTHQINFDYPKIGGIQALIKSLEEKNKDHIVTGFEVKKIHREGTRWIVSSEQEERSYDRIISTMPIHALVDALDAPEEIRRAAKGLRYNSLITVMIGLERHKINDLTWLYIPDEEALTHRVSFPSNYSPYVAPAGRSSVLAEITCNFGDKLWRMDDEYLVDRVIDDLDRLKIINKEKSALEM